MSQDHGQDDDFEDFLEAQEKSTSVNKNRNMDKAVASSSRDLIDDDDDDTDQHGKYCQYSFYGNGFLPTTATVPTLPAGIYEVFQNNNGQCYTSPVDMKEGILLELPEMRSEYVIGLIEQFWASEDDYKKGNDFVKGGALCKTGIMLYGPPGAGKSCTIKILIKKIIKDNGVVFMGNSTHPSILSQFLAMFSSIEPNRKLIVIFEDIDSLIEKFREDDYLQLLDGTMSIDNVLFIATTNYPEKLDPRIYNRPGRFSHIVKVGFPTRTARKAYLEAILKKHDDVDTIVDLTDNFTIDHLTSIIDSVYRQKKNLLEEISRIKKLYKIPKLGNEKPIGFMETNED